MNRGLLGNPISFTSKVTPFSDALGIGRENPDRQARWFSSVGGSVISEGGTP
jgi:hypothetical protein